MKLIIDSISRVDKLIRAIKNNALGLDLVNY
uniref:Uncharacterized protein n=1 Tax=Tetranychus urticae TaxID=32264 RepID=T1KGU3_TETUR